MHQHRHRAREHVERKLQKLLVGASYLHPLPWKRNSRIFWLTNRLSNQCEEQIHSTDACLRVMRATFRRVFASSMGWSFPGSVYNGTNVSFWYSERIFHRETYTKCVFVEVFRCYYSPFKRSHYLFLFTKPFYISLLIVLDKLEQIQILEIHSEWERRATRRDTIGMWSATR